MFYLESRKNQFISLVLENDKISENRVSYGSEFVYCGIILPLEVLGVESKIPNVFARVDIQRGLIDIECLYVISESGDDVRSRIL